MDRKKRQMWWYVRQGIEYRIITSCEIYTKEIVPQELKLKRSLLIKKWTNKLNIKLLKSKQMSNELLEMFYILSH